MRTIEQQRLEFLEDLCAHFNSTNRACSKTHCRCRYSHRYNGGCAIGRKLSKKLADELDGSGLGLSVRFTRIYVRLPEELKKLGKEFLANCQLLHDDAQCWDEQGLSDLGRARKESIIETHCRMLH